MEKQIGDFIESLKLEREVSDATVSGYDFWLRKFDTGIRVEDITEDTVQEFRKQLQNLSRASRTQALVAVRSFLRWLISHYYKTLPPERVILPKKREQKIKSLSEKELVTILEKADNPRDRAILEVLYSTGLRVSELTSLDKGEIDFDRHETQVVGKGGTRRIVYLSPTAIAYLDKYLDTRQDEEKALFLSRSKRRIGVRDVQALVRKYADKAGVKATPHSFRHTFATNLLRNGADVRYVQKFLGHKSLSSTQVYTHVTDNQLKEIHRKYHENPAQETTR